MLTVETKRHIDAARQVLVGVIPNPAAQIDQITNALIYKFMDDMDQSAVRAGDKPSFFVGELERYAWTRVMDSRLGNQERMNLYAEALVKFSTSQKLPELFRDIFRQAYLPFRSPDVLYLFLKEIDYFGYSHSEELGNAYEYLLSILSAQGDAGQFRTPRHVIDFIVDVVDPTPDDTVLDPACGTAGFLISAYKHILEKHTEIDKKTGKTKSTLTPIQRQKIMKNFEGYDISPEMVKLSRVNMYLHHFKNPKIYEYDTLSREERWNDKFSVILANPPFMSPKGGIKPHSRFSVQSSRSEVLFVDYFIEHLKQPNGRAGMIVPEGIIFQAGNAHRQIRENLVKDGLYAVVSLPVGVFNPYSGVKTSILFFDNAIVKKTEKLLFVKIENDGYSLGAQRRTVEKNDLPDALNILHAWKDHVLKGFSMPESPLMLVVDRTEVTKNNDWSLSAERYRVATDYSRSKWPMVELGEICSFEYGKPLKESNRVEGEYPVFGSNGIVGWHNEYLVKGPFIIVGRKGTAGAVTFSEKSGFPIDTAFYVVLRDTRVDLKFLYYLLRESGLEKVNTQSGVPGLNRNDAYRIKIPVPPLSVQKEIAKELDAYQNLIDGANEVLANWKPKISVDAEWPMVKLKDACRVESGTGFPVELQGRTGLKYPFLKVSDMNLQGNEMKIYLWNNSVGDEDLQNLGGMPQPKGTVIFPKIGAAIATNKKRILTRSSLYDNNVMGLIPGKEILSEYLYYFLLGIDLTTWASTASPPSIRKSDVEEFEIPLPDLATQKMLIDSIESERILVESNTKLVETYEQKMREKISKLL